MNEKPEGEGGGTRMIGLAVAGICLIGLEMERRSLATGAVLDSTAQKRIGFLSAGLLGGLIVGITSSPHAAIATLDALATPKKPSEENG